VISELENGDGAIKPDLLMVKHMAIEPEINVNSKLISPGSTLRL
jgi:hypothetical protein